MINKAVLVKIEKREYKKNTIDGQEIKFFDTYYIEFDKVKLYLDLPKQLGNLVSLGGELWVTWDRIAKYVTANRQFNWKVAPSQYNNELFQFLFARQMEMDLEGGEDE